MRPTATIDPYEQEILDAYAAGVLQSIADEGEFAALKAAARATAIKDQRVNIRLSSGDLRDIQAELMRIIA